MIHFVTSWTQRIFILHDMLWMQCVQMKRIKISMLIIRFKKVENIVGGHGQRFRACGNGVLQVDPDHHFARSCVIQIKSCVIQNKNIHTLDEEHQHVCIIVWCVQHFNEEKVFVVTVRLNVVEPNDSVNQVSLASRRKLGLVHTIKWNCCESHSVA